MKAWSLIPAEWAHNLSPFFLPIYAELYKSHSPRWREFQWRGLHFRNPLGLAGGVDKNAENLKAWWKLGCGFVEVGTVTPFPQNPNPGKIIDRDFKNEALWNKMGFPSQGAEKVLQNLNQYSLPRPTPLFVNIGKNRTTPNESALQDYQCLIERFQSLADVFVVNISSPNTTGLRDLQNPDHLIKLLRPLVDQANSSQKPILLKLSPDQEVNSYKETLLSALDSGVSGFVLTNTTTERDAALSFPREGGVSGRPLKSKSEAALTLAVQTLGDRRKGLLIVSCGGILSAEDVTQRLLLGADLVEIYSALVLKGPDFFKKVAQCQN